ncbi:MAG: M28 family peptidase, partial [Flavobacteriales bacterium]
AEQRATVKAYNGKELPLRNIIASFQPQAKERILLLAHYDTRPIADKDKERPHAPIPGANDGGSGVAVLLELARHLGAKQHGPGVDLLFTDVEDYGQPSGSFQPDEGTIDTWALGAQHFAKNPHTPGYTARFGILLDMVGARDARFFREAISMQHAAGVVSKVWRTAEAIGHGDRFVQETRHFVGTDDHLPINRQLRIPTIDIIEYHESTGGFHPSWHTHDDDLEVIDPQTLKAVGQTVLEVVWRER